MPRLARKSYKGEKLFHVMVQGINKETIFSKERERYEYIKLLRQYEKEYQLSIIAYCVMANHVHLLIDTIDVEELTRYMHKLNTTYAIYYNKNNDRVGYVYRDRYKTQIIENQRHLYNCIIYIHNNPVKASLCGTAEQYKFSSYKQFLCHENNELLTMLFQNKNEYIKAHKKTNIIENDFIEDEEGKNIDINKYIDSYLSENKIEKRDFKYENELLKPIVLKLYKIYNLSNREIERYLNISREKIRRIINELK